MKNWVMKRRKSTPAQAVAQKPKHIRALVSVFALGTAFALGASETAFAAEDVTPGSAISDYAVLVDEAGLLTDEERQSVSEQLQAVEEETGWTIFAVSTEDAGGKTSQAYADDFYDANTDAADGLVLLIDMDNRELTVSTSGEAISYLTDDRIDAMVDDGYAYVSDGDYAQCYMTLLSDVSRYYEKGIPDNAYTYDEETGKVVRHHAVSLLEFIVAVAAAAGVFAAVFLSVLGKYRLKFGTYSYDFHQFGKVSVQNSEDRLINQFVTHRRIPRPQENGGGGGGHSGRSTVHTGSSGNTHGGGSRKF